LERFEPGSVVVLRDIFRERVFHAVPVRVVCDTEELVALYLAPGTRWKSFAPQSSDVAERHRTIERLLGGVDALCDREWLWNHVLTLMRPGDAYSPWLMKPEDGSGATWYVNLQDPFGRTPIGFDTMDHILDVVVSPDGRSGSWKDEVEFAHATAIGIVDAEEAGAIRAAGEDVMKLVERGESWWIDWQDWAPDPSWPIPEFPAEWDVM
jgi:hypothetical protein